MIESIKFNQPVEPSCIIWRYMDFTKFVAMLESKSLYFTRCDQFTDKFEGSFSKGNRKLRPDKYRGLVESEEGLTKIENNLIELAKSQKLRTFVNCWHANPGESAAMWQLYTKTNEAIAIKTTFAKLEEQINQSNFDKPYINPSFYIGKVRYVDYDDEWIPENSLIGPFTYKRLSFSHENEIRLIILEGVDYKKNGGGFDIGYRSPYQGISLSIDLNKTIDSIYVAPTSPLWFKNLVEQVVSRYSLNTPVFQSSLDSDPFL